jgi:hypothetical protein
MSPDDDEEQEWLPVLDSLMLLKNNWPSSAWSWDERTNMLASSFGKDVAAKARQVAARSMQYAWDASTISTAPRGLQAIAARFGGLQPGQSIMAGKAGPLVLVGLWTPWRGGEMVTFRLGLGEYEAMEPPFPQVRELFGARA